MSVRAIEAEVSIKSGVSAECTIGREVIVEVHDDVTLESLTVTANGSYTPAEGVDGFSDVTVNVPERIPVTESLTATENGTYEPTEGIDGYNRVVVNVPPTIPEIEALTVTEDGTYTASGDGYNPVTVNTGVGALRQEIASAETASGCSPLTEGLTALTTYANEVTGAQDETLSDAVGTLASKYGKAEFNPFKYMSSFGEGFRDRELPETLIIDFEGNNTIYSLSSAFRGCTGLKHLIIKNLSASVNIDAIVRQNNDIETLTFEDCSFRATSLESFARAAAKLKAVYGEIDCSLCTGTNTVSFLFASSHLIESFRFKENSISKSMVDWTPNNTLITADSWISYANALNPQTPATTGLKSNNKTAINAILGNNVDGTFISDENGSLSLMDFITTVKGWTVT